MEFYVIQNEPGIESGSAWGPVRKGIDKERIFLFGFAVTH
jgi:hypothetical protein